MRGRSFQQVVYPGLKRVRDISQVSFPNLEAAKQRIFTVARVDGVHQFTDDLLLFCLRLFKKILGDGIFRNDFTDVDAGAFIEEVSAVTLIEQPSGTVNDRIGVRDRVGKSHTRISVLLDVLPAERIRV